MDVPTLRSLLELGWPAIVTVAFYFLARQYIASTDAQIARLWDRVATLETELIKVKQQLLDNHLTGER